jgi:hypothetical protein
VSERAREGTRIITANERAALHYSRCPAPDPVGSKGI